MSSRKQNSKPHNSEVAQHDPFAALKFRDYRLFTIGRLVLFVGSQMQTVAIGWELYERTNSAIALGGVGLAQVLPMIILTLIVGHVADRRDAYGGLRLRKLIILLSVMLLALCSLALGVLSYTKGAVFLIYACLVLTGIARAFLKPASDALMWQLIPVSAFTNAATWNSSSFQLAAVIGPAFGGFGIALLGSATGVYVLAAIAALLCFTLTLAIKEQKVIRKTEPISLKALSAGAKFVWQNQLILAAITRLDCCLV
ncbi:MFS transporter [Nostoc sp.]|uniref:MFS transporter n=1 Tax=Nostoc sp. TaxID=1180 RepID=UPI003FA58B2C